MFKVLLIARREYVAFVRTVGFWLSLVTLPVLIGAIMFVPVLLQSSAPVKQVNVAVLDLSGQNLDGALRAIVRGHESHGGADDAPGAFLHQIGHDERIRLVTTPPAIAAIHDREEADRKIPGLLGDATSTVLIAYDRDGVLAFDLWSVDKQEGNLRDAISGQLDELQYYRVAHERGVDPQAAKDMHAARAEVTVLTPAIVSAKGKDDGGFIRKLKDNAPRLMGAAMGYISWMSIFSSSMILLGGVIEEKSSKVLEVLLASAPTEALLIGKVLGVAMVLLTVAAIWAGAGVALGSYGMTMLPPDVVQGLAAAVAALFSPVHVALLLCYFVCGYLMFGVSFAAIGAFCETQKDAQAIMGPVMIVLMIPMMSMQAAFYGADSPILRYLSWVPVFSPFLMPLRLAGPLPWWEIAGTLVGMIAVAVFMVGVGRKAFRQGALTGGKLTWGTLFRIASRKSEV